MSAELPAPFEPADVDVFEFLSVRAYLKAYYEAKKGGSRAFSYRAFSRRVGVRSPNHLKRIIDGERTLTEPMAAQYAAAIGLADEARDYFLDMCAFARAEIRLASISQYCQIRDLSFSKRLRPIGDI